MLLQLKQRSGLRSVPCHPDPEYAERMTETSHLSSESDPELTTLHVRRAAAGDVESLG